MAIEEIKKIADELYPYAQTIDYNAIGHDAFVKGAMWMQEQFKINEEELEDIAIDEGHELSRKYGYDNSLEDENIFIDGFKEGYHKALKQ